MSHRYDKGGRSVAHAEQVGRGGKVMSTFEVYVHREATLDARLSDIETRAVRSITLLIHPGFDDMRAVTLDREDAVRLRDALSLALTATDGEAWL